MPFELNVAFQATKPLFLGGIMKPQNEREVFIMKNNITELVFILDRSGSMSGLESDTVGGFNSLIEKQKKQDGKCFVSTVLFNSETEVIHDRIDINDVPMMNENDYVPCGCTALIDAIGQSIKHISNIHKYARSEDIPEHTVFVITTDGMENASRKYSSDKVKKMIEKQKEQYNWEFLFIGANIDAVETAARYGIESDRAVNYKADKRGTKVVFETVCQAVGGLRASKKISSEWSKKIDEDFKERT